MNDSGVKPEEENERCSSNDSEDEYEKLPKFQLCDGLREDCERLAALVREELTVQALFDGWKELRFHRVYMGRRFFTELLEFTEEALVIARDLWLDAENDIRYQASHFLVLAGLYLRQPFTRPSKPARIRLTARHVDLVSTFIDNCDTNGFHDCVRLLDALFSEGALDLVAHPREFGLDNNTLAYLHRDAMLRTLPAMKEPQLRNLSEISELRTALAEYCAVKRGLPNAPNFVTSGRLDDLVTKDKKDDDDGDEDYKPDVEDSAEEEESIAVRRRRLRNRAFVNAAARKGSVLVTKVEDEDEEVEEQPKDRPRRKKRKLGIRSAKPARIKTFF